ncbi:HEAT repeat domain-containing protein [Anabaena azotica]|uniref:HEAT repeat domain-containing protein n=1 Tax=Anabaena azotica FACHB-119 TaxID=947527 RepID=A0ABR8CXR5_9NOST|nr:HEAT repeat domain-containing protein [Anabaena azotica]MBD2499279.1 HEAT repeat domain-containing protein [Anabaena azotica FACHB-119]
MTFQPNDELINPEINRLVQLLSTSTDEDTIRQVAESLGNIGSGNQQAINALVQILTISKDKYTIFNAAASLGNIGSGNQQAINALVQLLSISEDEYTIRQAAASLGNIGSGNQQAINALVQLLSISKDEYTIRQAAKSLGKIGSGNQQAIDAIVQLFNTSKDEYKISQAAESLGTINPGNQQAINALIQLLSTSKNENTLRQAAESLGNIGSGNQQAINALVKLFSTSKNENTLRQAAESLGNIGSGNQQAINALVKLLSTSKDENTVSQAAESLGTIDPGNQQAINTIVKLFSTSKNENTIRQAAESLGNIGSGNQQAINALVQLFSTSKNENTIRQAAESLGNIGSGNQQAINALVQLLGTSQVEYTVRQVAESLGTINPGNQQAIDALVQLLSTSQVEYTISKAAESLGKIGSGNQQAINALVKLLSISKNEDKIYQAAESLGTIDPGNQRAINAFVQLLSTSQDGYTIIKAAESLGKIGSGNQQAINALLQLLSTSNSISIRKHTAGIFKKISFGNLNVIKELKTLRHTTQSEYTRYLVEDILNEIDSVPNKNTQSQDDLMLFLQSVRVKGTVDEYFSVNNYQKTRFCYDRIIACLDKLQEGHDILTRRSLMNSYLELYKRIVSFAISNRDFQTAFYYTELFRNRYLVERISLQDMALPKTIPSELAQQINQAKHTERLKLQEYTNGINLNLDKNKLDGLSERWVESKQALEKLYAQVAINEPEFIAKTKICPITYTEVKDLLPTDSAIVEFFFSDKQLLIILLLPGEESPIIPESLRLPLNQLGLETLAQDWVSDITENKKGNKTDFNTKTTQISFIINAISDILKIQDVIRYIPSHIKHLIIIPHQYLHLFPIHALWINDSQRIIDRFSVSYFPNTQVWKICHNRQRVRESLISIENPTQDKDLIFVKAEVAGISQRQQFVQQQILVGKQASKAQILHLAGSNHCFHFSGHAEYNFKNPLDSYLMLGEDDKDNLSLNTIFTDLQMPHADLVTLSACCTGLVDAFAPTEEYLGLPTGFLLAGAKAVIGSLWKVNSIATAFLLDEFYRQLETINNKAVALQNAQNWLRSCTAEKLRERANSWNLSTLEPKEQILLEWSLDNLQHIPFENPYYWAAFILTGC